MQHAADSKHCRNCGTRLRVRGDLPRPPGPLPLPELRPRARPAPQVAATEVRLDGMTRLARAAAHAAGRRSSSPSPSPGSTTSTTRVAAAATALELGVPLATVGAALEGFGGAFGRVETIPMDGRQRVDPAGQEPRRRERGAAHAHARGRATRPLARPQRPDRRRPRRLLDLGRRLRGAGRPRATRDLQRHARRGDGAAPEVRRHRRRARRGARPRALARRRRVAARPASASTRCPPTPPCSTCATCWPAAASPSGGPSERRRDLARRGVRRLRRRPAALARARRGGRRADPRPRRGHRPRGARPRRRRPRRDRARRRPRPARRAGPPRAGARPATSRCITADARAVGAIGRFALVLAPMQFVQIMGGEPGRAALLDGVASCLASRRRLRGGDLRPRRGDRRGGRRAAAAGRRRARRVDLLEPAAGRAARAGRRGGRVAASGRVPGRQPDRAAPHADARLAHARRARARGGRAAGCGRRRATRSGTRTAYIGSTVVVCRR